MKTEIKKMNRKLKKLGHDFIDSDLYDTISKSGFGEAPVYFQPTGFEGRCVSSLEIELGQLHITFLVSHNNLEQVSVNVFNEDLFETDEDNCSFTVELPLKQLNLRLLKQIVFEEICNLYPEN
jgi:hypothetical protein